MSLEKKLESTKSSLIENYQIHLLKYWNDLTDEEKGNLLRDIEKLDIAKVNDYYVRASSSLETVKEKIDDRLEPIPQSKCESVLSMRDEKIKEYEAIGLDEIANGRVGVLLLAGGQGTRLGFDHPKGMYDVGLPSKKTLFQIQAERIRRLHKLAEKKTNKNGVITWYIMTSEHTMAPTQKFFEKNNYFGLRKEDIVFFEQGVLPCYDFKGYIILDCKGKVATAPDGNGGLYRALKSQKIIEDFERRGVKHLHVHSVDNILCKVADPVFIGYCITKGSDCAAKVVQKISPHEAVGAVCKVDGQYKVVEYSEISTETAERRNSDGSLTFNAGNICNHYFTADFLRKISEDDSMLKLHVAKKKIPYVNDDGVRHKPDNVNGIKIEKFIFDVFEYADNFVALEVDRNAEFSALKNPDSANKDCPSQVRNDLIKLHRNYIRKAGGTVSDSIDVEISPLVSYAGEDLEELVQGIEVITTPYVLRSSDEVFVVDDEK